MLLKLIKKGVVKVLIAKKYILFKYLNQIKKVLLK